MRGQSKRWMLCPAHTRPSRMSYILSATSLKAGADLMASTSVLNRRETAERSPGRMRVS
uniref:Uncharacterized protein n=1 Tax=Arundo donax TaxID=35708 RepID=A0A0A9U1N1_ARUDO